MYYDHLIVVVVVVVVVIDGSRNFNVVHYSKSIKGINTRFGIFALHDMAQLQEDKGHNSEGYSFCVILLLN